MLQSVVYLAQFQLIPAQGQMICSDLPIDAIIPELRASLRRSTRLILQAPPGAGKTTRVPLALLHEDWLQGKTLLMLEPRRLAASNAAAFMAGQLGEQVGRTVGYTIRYQRKISAQTRIEVVTEGILTRRLQQNPELPGVGLVIFDEFHERHLHSDLALALCYDVQQGLRNDLRLLVMSATLDGEPLATLLTAPLLTSEGRSYPVEIRYVPGSPRQKLVDTTVAGIHRALCETTGDLLVFLPGEGEIRRCQEQLADLSSHIDMRPLYGSLPFAEQEQAILPGPRRRVVLATNIAETSLTIEGIGAVVDSGYCRRARFDHGSGLTRLELARISQASATQRSGRAGRLGPGICYRLWNEAAQGALLPFTPPEIRTADLTPLALELLNWGIRDPEQLTWLDPPSASAWRTALELLELLGCTTAQGQLTDLGREAAEIPIHPRLGCLLLKARRLDQLPLGCDLAALLAEQDPWFNTQMPKQRSRSDLLDRLETYWEKQRQGSLQEFQTIERTARFWREYYHLDKAPLSTGEIDPDQLAELLLSAYPDRLGKLRVDSSDRYLLSSGQGAQLSERSALRREKYLIAIELRESAAREAQIVLASAVGDNLVDRLLVELPWQSNVFWDRDQGRVITITRRQLGALVLAEKPGPAEPEAVQQIILAVLREEGLQLLNISEETERFISRVNFLHRIFPDDSWPDFSPSALLQSLAEWLSPFLSTARTRTDLRKIDLLNALRSRFDWRQLQHLEKLAPERIRVPSGSQIRLQYPPDGPPVLAVKLQEMFGCTSTPTIAEGRCSLLIQLLSPAGRPLQTTQDLGHFWVQVYPEICKEMRGRYPKHPWPDNPLAALPTSKTKRSLARQEASEP